MILNRCLVPTVSETLAEEKNVGCVMCCCGVKIVWLVLLMALSISKPLKNKIILNYCAVML